MGSPLTITLVGSVPLMRATAKLSLDNAYISGYDAVDAFDEVNAVTLNVLELYPSKNVTLNGIKSFAEGRVDEDIVNAASLMVAADGVLKDVFLKVINYKEEMLLPVSELKVFDGGIYAKVGENPIVIGSRELMNEFEIKCPSADYEHKYVKSGRDILYISVNSEVSAMFVVTYQKSEEAQRNMDKLASREPSLLVVSSDPNLTPERIGHDFDYPEEFIRIIPSDLLDTLNDISSPCERDDALVISCGRLSVLRMLTSVFSIKKSITTATVLQLAGLVIGYALTAFLAFTGSIQSLGFIQLMIFQIFWALVVIVFPNIKSI